jgi:hypothetical protein
LMPAPPTPTTLITARYDPALSPIAISGSSRSVRTL